MRSENMRSEKQPKQAEMRFTQTHDLKHNGTDWILNYCDNCVYDIVINIYCSCSEKDKEDFFVYLVHVTILLGIAQRV